MMTTEHTVTQNRIRENLDFKPTRAVRNIELAGYKYSVKREQNPE